jgi:tyrosyl-tRNA synthetase
MSFVEELAWRGLLHQQTDERLAALMRAAPFTLYIGFDPTAPTLHVGSLLQITVLMRAQRLGHRPIAVVGGATGMIGDPSGKSEERRLLDEASLAANVAGLERVLGRFLDFSPGQAILENNHDWLGRLGYLEFLRDVGKSFSVNMMLGKESVRARLEDREHGISYTEFSYMLIQAYDFLHLYERHGCRLQCGGSDQWGNITAGVDLVRRRHQVEVYGLTTPLVTNAAGQKFGKTEKGAVWLDAERTSPYDFYQYFLRTDDRDVGRFLRFFTFLDEASLVALEETVAQAPEKREAQRVLAREVTRMVHGAEEAEKAERGAQALFSGDEGAIAQDPSVPRSVRARADLEAGIPLTRLLAEVKVCASGSAAQRDIAGGGIYVNGERVADPKRVLGPGDLRDGAMVILRKGKKTYHIVSFT